MSNGNGVHTATRDATRQLVTHARSLVQLELELAKLEVKRKAAATAVGAGLGATAAMLRPSWSPSSLPPRPPGSRRSSRCGRRS